MLLLDLDRAAPAPLFQQLVAGIARLVDEGSLKPGERLPPSRTLAEDLGVHRSTVVRAYRELRALGYLDSRSGSYSTVRRRAGFLAVEPAGAAPFDYLARATPAARAALRDLPADVGPPPDPRDPVDLSRLTADPALAPVEDLRRHLQRTLLRGRGAALEYGSGLGDPGLRDFLASRMRAHGISVSPEEVLVTQGAQQGLDLVLRMLVQQGDAVVVEGPSYAKALALLRVHGARVLQVPMRPDGLDLGALEAVLRAERPRLVYTMPTFHNPTGITTSQAHRERLLALCESFAVPLLEDGFEEELKYLGEAPLPLKSMDARGVAIYLGTFSKVAFPGLRLGWLAAPPSALPPLVALHRACHLSGVGLIQAAVARFCQSGGFEAYLRRIHRVYRRRMRALMAGLEAHLPAGVRWTRPRGGFTCWLTLDGVSLAETDLVARLLEAGVRVTPGAPFFLEPPATPHLRLSTAVEDEARIALGCRRLGEVLAAARRAPGGPG